MPYIGLRKETAVRQGFLEPEDLDQLLAALCRQPRDGAAIADIAELAYTTGLHRAPLLALEWKMVEQEVADGALVGAVLRIPGGVMKNGQPLTIPLAGRSLERPAAMVGAASPGLPVRLPSFRQAREALRGHLARRRHGGRARVVVVPRPAAILRARDAPGRRGRDHHHGDRRLEDGDHLPALRDR